MPGTLYLISLPIGNPDDISLRALHILRSVATIAAENVHVVAPLLTHHGVHSPCISYRKRSDRDTMAPILSRLEQGEDVALICDAGTPAIADPGHELARAAIARDIPVEVVPGPVAATAALVVSGLPTGRFAFDGFPPRARADRSAFFRRLANETRTILLYESAAGLRATLQDLARVLPEERQIVLTCELTTPRQWIFRGTLREALAQCAPRVRPGRYTLVIAGHTLAPL
ncbi:MAG: 16S rRNA (cytidine(1402)-2'-O)-methyltransferase [Chthonomonadaceae bacterium]|nr:16S rRNA (cytidine(1402)-2'-O)-methyltransferase [Chthonomonadaceae bacterium]